MTAVALVEEADRRAKVAALDAYLTELDAEFGPVPEAELQDAAVWADDVVPARPVTKQADSRARQARPA
jgi:hypothetical protein